MSQRRYRVITSIPHGPAFPEEIGYQAQVLVREARWFRREKWESIGILRVSKDRALLDVQADIKNRARLDKVVYERVVQIPDWEPPL